MFKFVALIALLACAVLSAPVPEQTPEESRAELLAAGISQQAADGILRIGAEAEQSQKRTDGSTPSPIETFFATIKLFKDLDAFVKTQSPEDQAAVTALFEKKKAAADAAQANGQH